MRGGMIDQVVGAAYVNTEVAIKSLQHSVYFCVKLRSLNAQRLCVAHSPSSVLNENIYYDL
jgi:hypothetical protein